MSQTTSTSPDGDAHRPYRLGARADAMARTRAEILEATAAAVLRDPPAFTIDSVATAAGVSTRTVIRHFGSRDGLFAAALRETERAVGEQRFEAPAGDVEALVAGLVDHYEHWGDHVIAILAEEGRGEEVDGLLARGRRLHRRWAHLKLGPLLGDMDSAARRRRLAQLVAITDVYTWKLLRRDQRLGRRETETAIAEMIRAVKGAAT